MRSKLKLVGLGVICVLFQSLAMAVSELRILPDLVLILAIGLGLRGERPGALIAAFGLGFAVDVLSSSHGLYALLRGTACAAAYVADRSLYLRSAGPWALYVMAYTAVDVALLGAVTRTLRPDVAPAWADLLWPLPIAAPLTAIFAAMFFPLILSRETTGSYDATWGTLRMKGRP